MKKIFFAIGYRQVEDYIKKSLENDFMFVGETVYREGIINGISKNSPDILIVRETLEGSENILDIIYNVRTNFPDIRIIFLGSNRKPGDALLASIVGYGIYDVLIGEKINVFDIIRIIKEPNNIADVKHLQPKISIDEKTNKRLFEAPNKIEKIYIEREVIVENECDDSNTDIDTNKEITIEEEVKSPPIIEEPKEVNPIIKCKVDHTVEKVKEDIKEPIIEKEPVELVMEKENIKKNNNSIKEPKSDQEGKKFPFGRKITKEPKEKKQEEIKSKFIDQKRIKQQIISFIGSNPGVGNSQMAFSTAISLAEKGFNVIYLDLNETFSAIGYLYQIQDYFKGIDISLKSIMNSEYANIDNSIITKDYLISHTDKNSLMIENYKKLPKNISFMFFSGSHMENIKDEHIEKDGQDLMLIKDLCMYLTFNKEYDFVVLDLPSNAGKLLKDVALSISTKLFFTITQDVTSISSNITQQTELTKNRINLANKIYYILNKYENATLKSRDIEEWINENVDNKVKINIHVPNINKDLIEANYIGLPIILATRNRDFKKAFVDILSNIF